MKLHNSVQHEAILSNVGEVGEFRIRNSAKAFSILSSGLYANKIRAIIRELSCNAVDSHTAAGNVDTPYDVHLPNVIEPWFSIRDYGTGLTHEQVTNIYTTYFESTKTDSNDFIGALGLGSKSPFSYTDNFTVTATKDGHKGIYTAFINDKGVPSIALMTEEKTSDPNGVEVKFSVNNQYDFATFEKEAAIVYKYFKQRPVIHGCKSFKFIEPQYQDRDIISGVHNLGAGYSQSIAVMGNIAYPIDIPQTDTSLGDLRGLLNCGLVLEFNIGELDFQASREGLSYIPSTVQSIKKKLEALNTQLAIHVANEANAIDNFWERAAYLSKRHSEQLFKAATIKYVADTKFPLADAASYNLLKPFVLKCADLANKYNIVIRGFTKDRYSDKCANTKPSLIMDDVTNAYVQAWRIHPSTDVHFVVNDTKRGALERAKYHWRNRKMTGTNESVLVIEPADKNKTMSFGSFMRDLYSPINVIYVTQLLEKNGKSGGNWGKASILKLTEQYRRRSDNKFVWNNAGCLADYDDNETYYYIAMNHWECLNTPTQDMHTFVNTLQRSGIYAGDIYGVRKNDIEAVRNKTNWVELNSFVRKQLEQKRSIDVMSLVKEGIDFKRVFRYTSSNLNQNSPYYKLYAEFKDVGDVDSYKAGNITYLLKLYNIKVNAVDPSKLITEYKDKVDKLMERYPLLKSLSYYADKDEVVDYINMVDTVKGN